MTPLPSVADSETTPPPPATSGIQFVTPDTTSSLLSEEDKRTVIDRNLARTQTADSEETNTVTISPVQ